MHPRVTSDVMPWLHYMLFEITSKDAKHMDVIHLNRSSMNNAETSFDICRMLLDFTFQYVILLSLFECSY